MSTKTSIKRLALIAVVALGLGTVSAVSANAAGNDKITPTVGIVLGSESAAATASGVVGGQVAFTFAPSTTDALNLSATGSTIVSATNDGANAFTKVNGTSFADGASWTPAADTDVATVKLTSSVAGSSVVTISKINATSGIRSSVATLTITWTAASSADLGSVTTYLRATNTCDDTVTASNISSMNYKSATNYLCVVLKDNSANVYTQNTASVAVTGNGVALIGGAAVSSSTTSTGYKVFTLTSSSLSGTATFSVTASATSTDGATTVSKSASTSLPVTGDFTAIKLANLKASITTGGVTGTLSYTGTDKDSNLAIVDLTAGSPTWYVQSDKGTAAITSTATNNSSATVTAAAADTIQRTLGSAAADTGRITVNGSVYEKLTIWVVKKNAAGVEITSNKVDVYVSTASSAAKSVDLQVTKNATGGYSVKAVSLSDPFTTKNAYPTVDGAAFTFGASNGVLSATSGSADETGAASVTWYPSGIGGSAIITATATDPATDIVVTKTISLDGALEAQIASTQTAIASLLAKINALAKLIAKIQKKLGVK